MCTKGREKLPHQQVVAVSDHNSIIGTRQWQLWMGWTVQLIHSRCWKNAIKILSLKTNPVMDDYQIVISLASSESLNTDSMWNLLSRILGSQLTNWIPTPLLRLIIGSEFQMSQEELWSPRVVSLIGCFGSSKTVTAKRGSILRDSLDLVIISANWMFFETHSTLWRPLASPSRT